MLRLSLLLSVLLHAFHLFAQQSPSAARKFTVSGFITDQTTGERLTGAVVYDEISQLGAQANSFGFYSLTLPGEEVRLRFSYVGYEPAYFTFVLSENKTISVPLKARELGTVEVVADRVQPIEEKTQMSAITIPVDQIKSLPRFMGEVDVLKALQLLPGVQSGTEGTSGFYVRGGSPDQNLILLDGVPIYNAAHLFGFFSVFNGEALNNVTLIKGGFPARYGGRLSSVLDLTTRDGNQNKIKGNINVGLVSSSVALDGPVIRGKSTFVIAARRTYIDILAQPIIKASSDGITAGYYFYDLNAKYTHQINDKSKLYVSFYGGNDKFYGRFRESSGHFKAGLGWGNIAAVLRLNRQHHPKIFGNYSLIYSRYKFNTKYDSEFEESGGTSSYYVNYFSSIKDVTVKADYDYYLSPKSTVRFGGNTTSHFFNPGALAAKSVNAGETELDTTMGLRPRPAQESYVYAEDEISLGDHLKVNAGLHFSSFFVDRVSYFSLQPRLSLRYLVSAKVSLKASYARMTQYLHLLTNAGLGLPTDLWVPATARINPQQAGQVAVGAATSLKGNFELSVEAYYKKQDQIIEYRDGESYMNTAESYEEKVTSGEGWSYGAEFFLQKKHGSFTGWIGYTLAWATRSFPEIDNGAKFPYRYDRRHDVSVVFSKNINNKIDISFTWVYGTGNAVTLPQQVLPGPPTPMGNFEGAGAYYYYGKNRNSFRMAPYHRADFNISFKKQKKKGLRTWNLSVYNLYNRQNPFFISSSQNYMTGRQEFTQYSLFPLIPSISYSYAF